MITAIYKVECVCIDVHCAVCLLIVDLVFSLLNLRLRL